MRKSSINVVVNYVKNSFVWLSNAISIQVVELNIMTNEVVAFACYLDN